MQAFRGISLRPVIRADLPMLFMLLNDPMRVHLWGQRRTCDELQFRDLWQFWSSERIVDKFTILKQGQPVGLVFDYERSLEDGHTKVAAMLLDHATGQGAGVIATALFGRWLFGNLPLRKAYLEVYEFNAAVVEILKKLGLRREMQRAGHRFWNGKYWDQFGFSLCQDDLPQLCQRLFRGRRDGKSKPPAGVGHRPTDELPSPSSGGEVPRGQVFDEAFQSLYAGHSTSASR